MLTYPAEAYNEGDLALISTLGSTWAEVFRSVSTSHPKLKPHQSDLVQPLASLIRCVSEGTAPCTTHQTLTDGTSYLALANEAVFNESVRNARLCYKDDTVMVNARQALEIISDDVEEWLSVPWEEDE